MNGATAFRDEVFLGRSIELHEHWHVVFARDAGPDIHLVAVRFGLGGSGRAVVTLRVQLGDLV